PVPFRLRNGIRPNAYLAVTLSRFSNRICPNECINIDTAREESIAEGIAKGEIREEKIEPYTIL
ncbi:MAG: hypothetical protein ACOC4C_05805, partial [Fibrobacterota bacterium]